MIATLRALTLVFATAALLGCGLFSRAPLTPPERGGPHWLEFSSAHFVLKTDNQIADARQIVAELERAYAAIATAMLHLHVEPNGKIEVVVFERREDFAFLAPEHAAAFFSDDTRLDIEQQALIVASGVTLEAGLPARDQIQHELAHRFLHQRLHAPPLWLDEGLAKYFETVRIAGDHLELGRPLLEARFTAEPNVWIARYHPMRQTELPLSYAPTLRELLDLDESSFMDAAGDPNRVLGRYLASWRLVHLLANAHGDGDRARFLDFLNAVWGGAKAKTAFLATFGDELPAIEAAFRAYLTTDDIPFWRVSFRAPPPEMLAVTSARPLPDAEVHLLWGRVAKKPPIEWVKAELDKAVACDPTSLEVRFRKAVFLLKSDRPDEAARELDSLLAANPYDPRYLLARIECYPGRALLPAPKRPSDAALDSLVERLGRAAESASELNEVAWHYATRMDPDAGLPIAERSLKLDPTCWNCADTYSVLLFEEGNVDAALEANARASGLVAEAEKPPPVLLEHKKLFTLAAPK